jgi:hypothetical protein
MGNNNPRKGQHNTQRQTTRQSNPKLSREQLIFRLETLREELEETPGISEHRKVQIQGDMARYSEQLNKF